MNGTKKTAIRRVRRIHWAEAEQQLSRIWSSKENLTQKWLCCAAAGLSTHPPKKSSNNCCARGLRPNHTRFAKIAPRRGQPERFASYTTRRSSSFCIELIAVGERSLCLLRDAISCAEALIEKSHLLP